MQDQKEKARHFLLESINEVRDIQCAGIKLAEAQDTAGPDRRRKTKAGKQ